MCNIKECQALLWSVSDYLGLNTLGGIEGIVHLV